MDSVPHDHIQPSTWQWLIDRLEHPLNLAKRVTFGLRNYGNKGKDIPTVLRKGKIIVFGQKAPSTGGLTPGNLVNIGRSVQLTMLQQER